MEAVRDTQAGNRGVAERLIEIVSAYEGAARGLATRGAPRDTAQLLAWTRQASDAVTPVYWGGSIPSPGLFECFVEASVVLVILLEDVGETFHGPETDALERDVAAQAKGWIAERRGGRSRRSRCRRPGGAAVARYREAVEEAFALVDDLVAALCPRAMQRPESQRVVDGFLADAVEEVLDALEFSRRFDRLARGVGKPFRGRVGRGTRWIALRDLDLDEFLAANQANIFMRAMLTVNLLHALDPVAEGASAPEIAAWIDTVAPLGRAIEQLGNLSNDLATLFREIGEGFVANFVLADALVGGVVSPAALRGVFSELESTLSTPARKSLLQELARAFFEGRAPAALSELAQRHPELPETRDFLEALDASDLLQRGVRRWEQQFESGRRDGEEHALRAVMDLDDLWDRQRRFLALYLTANGLV